MATKIIAWGSGTGNITLTYGGQGNGAILVSSDPNNLYTSRSKTITVKTNDNSITRTVTVVQAAKDNPADKYLTFDVVTAATFRCKNLALNYSLDNGSTWTTLAANATTPTIAAGSKVLWKANIASGSSGAFRFYTSGTFNVEGNPLSLVYGDNFIGQTTLPTGGFNNMFYNSIGLLSAENLVLVATTLVTNCYQNMFYGCTSLTKAPVLPALTLVNSCYQGMFNGCSSLTYIKAMFTTTPGTSYTKNWVEGVASSGTFVKNSAATWNVAGVNGVPSGWTVQTESS